MVVRLFAQTGEFVGTTETRSPRLRERTIRHQGIPYELIADDVHGRTYRATEPIPPALTETVAVIDSGGNVCARVPVPIGTIPEAVTAHGLNCPLWTIKDQTGRPIYLKPEAA